MFRLLSVFHEDAHLVPPRIAYGFKRNSTLALPADVLMSLAL